MLLTAATATGLLAAPAAAQRSAPALPAATVGFADPVYDAVDQLVALAPVPGVVLGQRPYSVREIRRLTRAVRETAAARTRPPTAAESRAVALAAQVERALGTPASGDSTGAPTGGSALRLRPLEALWLTGTASTDAPVRVPPDNGIGRIDAVTLPILDDRFGRPVARGGVALVETSHALGIGDRVALVAQPRVAVVADRDGATRVTAEPQRLYARGVVRNVALNVGIDERLWGQSVPVGVPYGGGGAFLSSNARPLRAVSIAADTAFALPGFLRGAGRWRAELVVADLGRDQYFPRSKLAAYKVNVAPSASTEFGVGLMSEFGGHGAPALSTWDRVVDLAPFIGWLKKGTDKLASNKIANAEARVRVPALRGATAFWEMSMDDFDLRRVRSMLWDDSGQRFGLSLPRLTDDGALSLDVQFQHTSLRLYEHGQFYSGVTYREQILGSSLGPNAEGLTGALSWRPTLALTARLSVTGERRDASRYTSTVSDRQEDNFTFVRTTPLPVERRLRVVAVIERGLVGDAVRLTARAGAERITAPRFTDTRAQHAGFAEAGLALRF